MIKKNQNPVLNTERRPASRLGRETRPPERLKTEVAFKISSQAYLWFTDRGRSRLIKH